MGYESKITVVGVGQWHSFDGGTDIWADSIMTLNLAKMGDFSSIFTRPINDFHIYYYLEDGNTKVDGTFTDPYGDVPKVRGVKEVLAWLKQDLDKQKADGEVLYRRELMLYDSLKTFKHKQWDGMDIYVVHTGY